MKSWATLITIKNAGPETRFLVGLRPERSPQKLFTSIFYSQILPIQQTRFMQQIFRPDIGSLPEVLPKTDNSVFSGILVASFSLINIFILPKNSAINLSAYLWKFTISIITNGINLSQIIYSNLITPSSQLYMAQELVIWPINSVL